MTRMCPTVVQAEVERRVLTRIATAGTTDVRRLLEQVIPEVEADLDPDLTRQRLENARKDRGVWVTPMPNGMCQVGASLDVLTGRRWALDFEELVRAQRLLDRRDGLVRTQAQRRADVFAQLPSRLIALLQAIQQGRVAELLDLATADPAAAASIQELAEATTDLAATPELRTDVQPHLPDSEPGEMDDPGTTERGPGSRGGWDDGPWDEPHGDEAPGLGRPAVAEPPAAGTPCGGPPGSAEFPPPGEAALSAESAPPGEAAPPAEPAHPAEPTPPPPPLTWGWRQLALACLRLPVRNPRVIDVHIPMTTLLELDNRTGWVEGLGPVPALLTRLLLPVAGLRRIYVDPRHGVPLGVDPVIHPATSPNQPSPNETASDAPAAAGVPASAEDGRARLLAMLGPAVLTHTAASQHDPSGSLQQLVRIRDQRCTGIGCSRQASACDLDHERPYPQGPTAEWNLSSKSRRCHRAKHSCWSTERAEDGSTTWTSRLGHSYVRPGVWEAPTVVPHDLRLAPATTTALDTEEPWLLELPLWPTAQE